MWPAYDICDLLPDAFFQNNAPRYGDGVPWEVLPHKRNTITI